MPPLFTGSWVGIISILCGILCFYFTLTFFENLRKGDERITKQTKSAAIIFLSLALLLPAIFNFYLFVQMDA